MSSDDGLFDEMSFFSRRRRAPAPLDDDTATRLLGGALHEGDAPPGYAEVAGLLRAASAPPSRAELAGEAAARETFRVARLGDPTNAADHRRRRAPVLVAAGLVLALLGGTAVAAATGSLPGGMQGTAHDLLDGIGVSVPDRGHDAAGQEGAGDRRANGTEGGADVPGGKGLTAASATGLCQAYRSGAERKERATAFERLVAAAKDAPGATARERVASYCAGIAAAHPATTAPPTTPTLAPDPASGNGNGGNSGGGTGNPANGNGNGGNSGGNAGGGSPNAGGGSPNAGGGNPNAGGGNPNAGGGNGQP